MARGIAYIIFKRLDSKTIDSISILYPRVSIVIYGKL